MTHSAKLGLLAAPPERPDGGSLGPAVALWRLFEAGRWDEASTLLHPAFTARWPQSGECFRGPANYIAVNRAHPAPGWVLIVVGVVETPTACAVQLTLGHAEGVEHGSCLYTLTDGLLVESSEIWAERAPAPAWRAAWTDCAVLNTR